MISNNAALAATTLERQSTLRFPQVVARLIVVVMTMLLSLCDGDPCAATRVTSSRLEGHLDYIGTPATSVSQRNSCTEPHESVVKTTADERPAVAWSALLGLALAKVAFHLIAAGPLAWGYMTDELYFLDTID